MLAGVLVPVLALGLLPRVGGAVLAGLATTSWLAAAWLGSPTGATSTRDERPDVAFAAGLALGAVPLVHLAAIPWLSPDPALLAWLLGGVVLGVGAGRELPKLSGPVTVALPALGLAAAADLLPRMPTMVEVAHLRFGEPEALLYQLPGVLLGAVGLVIGLGGGRARVTARFTWGVTAGMAAWLILPPLIGVGPALYVAAILAALYAVGLAITFGLTGIGMTTGIAIGLLAGFLNIIPYFGFVIGFGLSILVSIIDWEPAAIAGVLVTFAVVQGLEGYVITPRVVGEKVGLSPVVVIIALLVGGELLGLLGVLLALPLAGIGRVLLPDVLEAYQKSTFFTGDLPAEAEE